MTSVETGPLLVSERDGVATITFNRPDARNALTPEMLCRFDEALAACEADGSVRVIILTGAGEQAFCAGGDSHKVCPCSQARARHQTIGTGAS